MMQKNYFRQKPKRWDIFHFMTFHFGPISLGEKSLFKKKTILHFLLTGLLNFNYFGLLNWIYTYDISAIFWLILAHYNFVLLAIHSYLVELLPLKTTDL